MRLREVKELARSYAVGAWTWTEAAWLQSEFCATTQAVLCTNRYPGRRTRRQKWKSMPENGCTAGVFPSPYFQSSLCPVMLFPGPTYIFYHRFSTTWACFSSCLIPHLPAIFMSEKSNNRKYPSWGQRRYIEGCHKENPFFEFQFYFRKNWSFVILGGNTLFFFSHHLKTVHLNEAEGHMREFFRWVTMKLSWTLVLIQHFVMID